MSGNFGTKEWWKNFGLGLEIDASGTFIYNGIKTLNDIDSLNNSSEIFEILYDISIGLERLLKVAIVLVEHHDDIDMERFEESLITHNTTDLANRLNKKVEIGLSNIHREFLDLISKFYKSHRYNRFSVSSVPNIESEKILFLTFIKKHLKLSFNMHDEHEFIHNTKQIKKFVGKLVKKITDEVYSIVRNRAREINLYTYEIRSDSKAFKVFMGDRLDFIVETIVKKELIIFLMDPNNNGNQIEFIRSYKSLELDPERAPEYIKALLYNYDLPYVNEEVEEFYHDLQNKKERLESLEMIGENVNFPEEDEYK